MDEITSGSIKGVRLLTKSLEANSVIFLNGKINHEYAQSNLALHVIIVHS